MNVREWLNHLCDNSARKEWQRLEQEATILLRIGYPLSELMLACSPEGKYEILPKSCLGERR